MKLLTNLTLGKRITLLTALGLVLAVTFFGLLGSQAVNQATETMLQDRLTTAQLVADYLDEVLRRALTELTATAQQVRSDGDKADLESRMAALENTFEKLAMHPESIYLVNEWGMITWSSPTVSAGAGTDMSLYSSVSKTIMEKEASVSALVSLPYAFNPVVLLSAPVRGQQQGTTGALVVAIDLSQSSIGGFVQPIRLGQTGYVEIVDQSGIVVIRTEPGPKLAPFEKSDHSGRFAALIAAGEPTRGLCHTCHEPVQRVERNDVLAFAPLSEARWGVVIRQTEEEALTPVSELRRNLLLFGAGLITVALLFVGITTRDVTSRIRLLTKASERIASGDLTSPTNISQKDELGVLARSFEDMRTKLKSSREELEQRTRELTSLLSVSEILTSLPDLSNLDAALGSALDKTLGIMNANIGGILLFDEDDQKLRHKVYRGLSDKYVREVSLSSGEGIAGRVAQTGEAIWLEDVSTDPRTAYPDLAGEEGLKGFVCVPLRTKNKVLGVLYIADRGTKRFSAQDVRLLEGIGGQIATAIENARLHREVQHKDKVRRELLRQILSIQEEERRRIARELHDETSQVLASLTANLEAASGMLPTDSDAVKARLKEAQTLSISVLDEVHRLIYQLRPSLLDDLGLVTAVRWLADNNLRPTGIKVSYKTVGRIRRLDAQLETTLFRVIQEAVNNIAKHAGARNAEVNLHFKKNTIGVRVRDDGSGFDVEEAISSKDRPRGLGLLGMKERIELMDGTLKIQSHPGGGTEIHIEIPLN